MACLFFNVYWFLHILQPALFPQANTQSSDVLAYLPVDYTTNRMSLCTSLAVYNHMKKVTMGESTPVPGQKKPAAQGWVGVLQIVFWLSGKYMQDLRFVHRTTKFQNITRRFLCLHLSESNFVFTLIRELFQRSTQGS